MKEDERLIYAVVGTRGGGGGGGKNMRSVHRVLLWRVALGRAVWRAAFVYVGSAYQHTMIGGVFGVVKGGFSQDGWIPAYAGMTGGGWK